MQVDGTVLMSTDYITKRANYLAQVGGGNEEWGLARPPPAGIVQYLSVFGLKEQHSGLV